MPYQLVRDAVSRDTVEAISQLLEGAKSGEITGIAFGVFLRNRRYITNVAGTCYHNATTARGMVAALDDELSRIVESRSDSETR